MAISRVFVDTNVLFEAFRVGALCIATADKAVIVACGELKCLDCVRSFEKLLRDCGTPDEILVRLSKEYQESSLSGVKTKVRLGMIP